MQEDIYRNLINTQIFSIVNKTSELNQGRTVVNTENLSNEINYIKNLITTEFNGLLFHGTSSIVIPFIKRHGLGRFPDELFLRLQDIFNASRNFNNPETVPGRVVPEHEIFKPNSPFIQHSNFRRVNSKGNAYNGYIFLRNLRESNSHETYFARNITISQIYGRDGNIGEYPRNILHNLRLWLDFPNYVSKYSSRMPTNEAHRQRIERACIAAEQIEIEERKNFCANEIEDLLKILDPPVKRQVFLAIINNTQQQNNFVRGLSSLPDDPAGIYMTRLTIPPEKIFVYDPGNPSIGIIPCLIPLINYV
jgi:hypothetical protein